MGVVDAGIEEGPRFCFLQQRGHRNECQLGDLPQFGSGLVETSRRSRKLNLTGGEPPLHTWGVVKVQVASSLAGHRQERLFDGRDTGRGHELPRRGIGEHLALVHDDNPVGLADLIAQMRRPQHRDGAFDPHGQ